MTSKEESLAAIRLLKYAVDRCYSKDQELIEKGMEQASVARIFYYIQEILDHPRGKKCFQLECAYNVDCEYNKNGQGIKATPRRPKGSKPDLIIHRRGDNSNNLLVVEFKSHKNSRNKNDIEKLEDFTRHDIFNYRVGAFVKLKKKSPAEYRFFVDGREVTEEEI